MFTCAVCGVETGTLCNPYECRDRLKTQLDEARRERAETNEIAEARVDAYAKQRDRFAEENAALRAERDEALARERTLLEELRAEREQGLVRVNVQRQITEQATTTLRAELARKTEALREIAKMGRVCNDYDTCAHESCSDSCGAALTAINILGPGWAEPKAGGPEPRHDWSVVEGGFQLCAKCGARFGYDDLSGASKPCRGGAPRAAREPDECEAVAREWLKNWSTTRAFNQSHVDALAALLRSRDSATELRVWNEAVESSAAVADVHYGGMGQHIGRLIRTLARAATKPGEP